MARKEVTYRPSRYTQKRRARKAVDKAGNEHGLDVLRDRTRYNPNQEQYKGNNVNRSTAVELVKSVMRQHAQL